MEKKTKDLTEQEILQFKKSELRYWMNRVMARLYKLLENEKQQYARLAAEYVARCSLGLEQAKLGLIDLVKVIKELWLEPALHVVK